MNKAPVVIRIAGRAKRANLDGESIYREEQIFVPSERTWFKTIETYDHFCYYNGRRFGSTLMCTCGSFAGVYGFEAYGQFQSTNMGRIICCSSLIENGMHADGSTS